MDAMSRRDFGRLAAGVGMFGVAGTLAACGTPPTPPRAERTETATPIPDNRTRPINRLHTSADWR